MNRIYQGRATRLEVLSSSGKEIVVDQVYDDQALKHQNQPLWSHHEIFQDAVNYYLVALAALARHASSQDAGNSDTERLAADLNGRVESFWDSFRDLPDARSLKKSLTFWLGLEKNATLEDAFDQILAGNPAAPEVLKLSLQLILDKCAGDSAIQQGGREYLPKLTVAQTETGKPYSGSFDFDTVSIASAKGKEQLAEAIHGTATDAELATLAGEMDISWAGIKCKPDEVIAGDDLKERLHAGVKHQRKRFTDPTTNAERELLETEPSIFNCLDEIEARISALPEDTSLAVNKGGNISWDLVHAAYLFRLFPSRTTAAMLALSVKKPKPVRENEASKGIDFAKLGDDPVKLARGERGFVFSAFTALPSWRPKSAGQPVWKEFDIAAFKEALKSLNQFNQKTAERNETGKYLRGKITLLLGGSKPSGWGPRKTEGGDLEAMPKPLDEGLLKLTWDLEKRLTEELPDTVLRPESNDLHLADATPYPNRDGQWRVSMASLRGFRDIAEKWNSLAEENGDLLSEGDLEHVVKAYQQNEKNKKQVGSIPLLLALCHQDFWALWKKEKDPKQEDLPTYNRFLFHVIQLHQDVRDLHRSGEAINLTPAEPRHSRRLYLFSDITGKEKVIFRNDGELETTLALKDGASCRKQRVRISFSAPRLYRDQILGKEGSQWLQPMTAALGYEVPEDKGLSAVGLMPDLDREGNTRFLLNFPKTIDESWLKKALGKDVVWTHQFNGIKGKNLHLHWPGTMKEAQQTTAWWNHQPFQKRGFWTLSVDLGQRTAGAYSRVFVTTKKPGNDEKRPWHILGEAGEFTWYAILGVSGMLRLPGEDQKVHRPVIDEKGNKIPGSTTFARELGGSAGRKATTNEYGKAIEIAKMLGAEDGDLVEGSDAAARAWIGEAERDRSFPEQNDKLITLANRRLSRLNTFHRWSCQDAALADERKDGLTKIRMVAALLAELSHWSDEDVTKWHQELRKSHPYLNSLFASPQTDPKTGSKTRLSESKKVGSTWSDEQRTLWEENFDPAHFADFSDSAGREFARLRDELREVLLKLAHRTAPLRGKKWVWETREPNHPDKAAYGLLNWAMESGGAAPRIRGQRGLSMDRLEQLESLRTLFLRYNRSLDKTLGERSEAGFGFSREAGEPAELLLKKIDRMKDQRVNQTAHLILAQALGVRLREHEIPDDERKRRDIHGEYEKMEKYDPVEFVVIENLDRYLTSQGRAPSENRRLMKWAHRAVRDKLKMLCEEPFGIPVVEAPAAYSSRFSAKTSEPGSRCREYTALDPFLRKRIQARTQTAPPKPKKDNRELYERLLAQFDALETYNAARTGRKKKPATLLFPQPGGPLFMGAVSGGPVQADANAAANVGLRALASPSALHLIHKLRTERKKGDLKPVLKNAREKAAFKGDQVELTLAGAPSKKLQQASKPNFFHLPELCKESFDYDAATLRCDGITHRLISGIAMHTKTDDLVLERIVKLNDERLSAKNISIA